MDWGDYLRFILALVFVVGLIGLLAWAGKRFGFGPRPTTPGGRDRLAIVGVITVDARRRLVLVRRDDVEHLLLLGQSEDLVIEHGIPAPGGIAALVPAVSDDAEDGR
jgi:flagellar protein FliO/FliZ